VELHKKLNKNVYVFFNYTYPIWGMMIWSREEQSTESGLSNKTDPAGVLKNSMFSQDKTLHMTLTNKEMR